MQLYLLLLHSSSLQRPPAWTRWPEVGSITIPPPEE